MNPISSIESTPVIICFVIIVVVYLYLSVDKIDESSPEASPIGQPHRRDNELTKRVQKRMLVQTIVL